MLQHVLAFDAHQLTTGAACSRSGVMQYSTAVAFCQAALVHGHWGLLQTLLCGLVVGSFSPVGKSRVSWFPALPLKPQNRVSQAVHDSGCR